MEGTVNRPDRSPPSLAADRRRPTKPNTVTMLVKDGDEKASFNDYGFPQGYFVLRSVSCGRMLDVSSDSVQDGAPLILWPEKDNSLVEGLRRPESLNQVFFIDANGALCARSSGHALDIENGRLVLRHRRPLTHPYPNAYSHPLPRFRYDGHTRRLTVEFENDPEFAGGTAWRAKTFHLAALPRPRPRTLLDDATDVLSSAFRAPLSLFGSPSSSAHDSIAAGTDDTFNLRQEEVEEQDRGEDAEADDDPGRDRAVRVIGLTRQEHLELGDKAWARRQWEVLPLRTTAARYSTLS